jgi:hypothetical protein
MCTKHVTDVLLSVGLLYFKSTLLKDNFFLKLLTYLNVSGLILKLMLIAVLDFGMLVNIETIEFGILAAVNVEYDTL